MISSLGDPDQHPNNWWSFLRDFGCKWNLIVDSYHTVFDDLQITPADGSITPKLCFPCATCGRKFASEKNCLQHARAKLKQISLLARCVWDTSLCSFCGANFHNRVTLITRLCDLRIRSKFRGTSCGIFATLTLCRFLQSRGVH